MGLIAIILFFVSFACNSFWQAGMTAIMLQNFSEEGKILYYGVMKRISFTMIAVCFVFAVMNGQFTSFTIWNALFVVSCVPLGVLIVTSIRAKVSVFENKLFKNKVLDFLLFELPLCYIFVLIWLKMFAIVASGN